MHRFSRLQNPVADQHDAERDDGRAFEAHHRIDPFANSGILFEVPRIDQVHAPGPGNLAIDHNDLAVEPDVSATDHTAQYSNPGFDHLHAASRRRGG